MVRGDIFFIPKNLTKQEGKKGNNHRIDFNKYSSIKNRFLSDGTGSTKLVACRAMVASGDLKTGSRVSQSLATQA